jgi:hypothetical protein
VDLDDLRALPTSPETVKAATERIMDAITELLAKLRGEEPPAERFGPEDGEGSRNGGGTAVVESGAGTGGVGAGAGISEAGVSEAGISEDEIGKQVDTA